MSIARRSVLMIVADRSEAQAKTIINTWLELGILTKGNYLHKESRDSVSCVVLDEVRATKLLADLNRFEAPPTD